MKKLDEVELSAEGGHFGGGRMRMGFVLAMVATVCLVACSEGSTEHEPASTIGASPLRTGSPISGSPNCVPSPSPLYCTYTVQEGDNLGKIAARFNIKGNDDVLPWEILVWSNRPDILSEDDLLKVGQKLRISLYPSGVIHTVLRAQTLDAIAYLYGVTPEEIIAVAANDLRAGNSVIIGQELVIPNPRRLGPATATASSGARNTGPRSVSAFMWPTTGPISSYFGPSHPGGIDIDLFANPNAPIAASASGTVVFAGGDACCDVGLYVILDHGNGIVTLYGQLSRIDVRAGEIVSQGQTVGLGGRTGYATGNHLHFEVHLNGITVNPVDYLP